jgi:hypothetical protein
VTVQEEGRDILREGSNIGSNCTRSSISKTLVNIILCATVKLEHSMLFAMVCKVRKVPDGLHPHASELSRSLQLINGCGQKVVGVLSGCGYGAR